MKKIIVLVLFFCGLIPFLRAQEADAPRVNENALLVQKEIAVWRTGETYNTLASVYSCQAVQIHPNWFLTAAHCVYRACGGSEACTVQVTLAEGELREQVRIYHSPSSQRVFIYDGFFPGQNRISSVDVALIRFEREAAEYAFAAYDKGEWTDISQERFNKLLKDSPETKAQLNARSVRLVSAANLPNAWFKLGIVVPKMTGGVLSYLESPSKDIYFVEKLQHFISPGFGVRRGNSGGGVFTPQGDLAGLVSSLMYSKNGSASFYDSEGKTVLTLRHANDYFFFTGFNGATMNFIRNKVPSVRTIGALSGFAEPVEKDFNGIIKAVNGASLDF